MYSRRKIDHNLIINMLFREKKTTTIFICHHHGTVESKLQIFNSIRYVRHLLNNLIDLKRILLLLFSTRAFFSIA